MCIALYVPNGVKAPDEETLERCFNRNSDGSGFGWYNKKEKTWVVSKGFMTFKQFWEAFKAKKFKDSTDLVIHFRIGTSGRRVHPDCTHPFPVADNFEDMVAHEFKSKNIVLHNGIVGFGEGNASDTMVAIKQHADPLWPYLNDEKVLKLLGGLLESDRSRWLLAKEDEVVLLGTWVEDNGISYSNEGFRPPKPIKPTRAERRRAAREGGWASAELETVYSIYSFKNYAVGDSFSWKLFQKYLDQREEQLKAVSSYTKVRRTPTVADDGSEMGRSAPFIRDLSDVDDVFEVFDADSKVIAVVDNNGDIIWDDPAEEAEVHNTNTCPNCPEEKNIVNSPFSAGDSMCCRCGAVYVHALQGDEAILMWDIDIQRQYRNMLEIQQGKE
jgi:hypothetical protein